MMSLALERSNRIEGPGFIGAITSCIPIYDSPEVVSALSKDRRFLSAEQPSPWPAMVQARMDPEVVGVLPVDRRFLAGEPPVPWTAAVEAREESSSSSSSIGRNSDSSRSDDGVSGDAEVQSRFKGPLDTMDSLEDTLPIRRGISKFYRGKSKSFTSLADVSPSSKDLTKLVNSGPRKRKNFLAFGRPMRSIGGTLSKRPANTSRNMLLPLATNTSSSDSNGDDAGEREQEQEQEPSRLLPPLHPRRKISSPLGTSPPQKCLFSMRSFSLTDLQGATASKF